MSPAQGVKNAHILPLPLVRAILLTLLASLAITAILGFGLLTSKVEATDYYIGAVVEFAPTESDAFESPKEVTIRRMESEYYSSISNRCSPSTLISTWATSGGRRRRGRTSSSSRSTGSLGRGWATSRTGSGPGSSWWSGRSAGEEKLVVIT